MANVNVTPTLAGSIEGAITGTFVMASGSASGTTFTVADTGVGANTQVFLQQGAGAAGTNVNLAVTSITPGSGFVVTLTSGAALGANVTVSYIRFD